MKEEKDEKKTHPYIILLLPSKRSSADQNAWLG